MQCIVSKMVLLSLGCKFFAGDEIDKVYNMAKESYTEAVAAIINVNCS